MDDSKQELGNFFSGNSKYVTVKQYDPETNINHLLFRSGEDEIAYIVEKFVPEELSLYMDLLLMVGYSVSSGESIETFFPVTSKVVNLLNDGNHLELFIFFSVIDTNNGFYIPEKVLYWFEDSYLNVIGENMLRSKSDDAKLIREGLVSSLYDLFERELILNNRSIYNRLSVISQRLN